MTARHSYDATPAAVWAMLTDRAFRAEVCAATGATSWDVSVDADANGAAVRVSRELPAPSRLESLVGETVTIVQTEAWGTVDGGGERRAELLVEVAGQPASLTGTQALSPSGSGAVLDVAGELRVRIPLVGGSLEKQLAKAVSAALETEHDVGRRWLSR